ncbi:MAG TPA: hypothetical protein VF588_09965 [Pyrinomonadaceae bacterium]|jgi:hypothetical protein
MGITEIESLCYRNAQGGQPLYQADEGGGIKIMFKQEENKQGHESHHHSHPDDGSTHHEHSHDAEPGGSHDQQPHEHTHGAATRAESGETAGRHPHEKGAHITEHDANEHHPA